MSRDFVDDPYAVYNPALDVTGTAAPGSYDRMLAAKDAATLANRAVHPRTGKDVARADLARELEAQEAKDAANRPKVIAEVKTEVKRLQRARKDLADEADAVYVSLGEMRKAHGTDPTVIVRRRAAHEWASMQDRLSAFDSQIAHAQNLLTEIEQAPL